MEAKEYDYFDYFSFYFVLEKQKSLIFTVPRRRWEQLWKNPRIFPNLVHRCYSFVNKSIFFNCCYQRRNNVWVFWREDQLPPHQYKFVVVSTFSYEFAMWQKIINIVLFVNFQQSFRFIFLNTQLEVFSNLQAPDTETKGDPPKPSSMPSAITSCLETKRDSVFFSKHRK